MGNWRTVQIIGSCSKEDTSALRKAIIYDIHSDARQEFYCLSHTGGLAGLPMWPAETINAIGNLAERGYAVNDIAEALRELVQIAPSLSVKIHCGGEWESKSCVTTIHLKDGKITINPPEIEVLPDPPEEQWIAHFYEQMRQ